jgi:hypothetical protein
LLTQENSKELNTPCDSGSKSINHYHLFHPNCQFLEVNIVEKPVTIIQVPESFFVKSLGKKSWQ